MTADTSSKILDGSAVAKSWEARFKPRVEALVAGNGGVVPVLATILVGDDPASATYVKMKGNACRRVGMDSRSVLLDDSTTTEQLLAVIDELNADPAVHGILLQHPVPAQIDERACFDAIATAKDVDGVTAKGFGLMTMGEPAYGSATPGGIMRLLADYDIDITGMNAVVVGRSPILGKPMAMMLLNANATVTICHSHTRDLAEQVRRADLLVAAVGRPEFIQSDWISDDCIVIDAGYHPGGVGDVALDDSVKQRCRYFTPVPGGVGPMTINTLIAQTLAAAEAAAENN